MSSEIMRNGAETDDEPSEDRPVGYMRPPRKHQFRPGESGNPGGRPRGSKSFLTALDRELDSAIAVTENGKRKVISKREAIAKKLVDKAVGGDPRAIPTVLNEIRPLEDAAKMTSTSAVLGRPEDLLVMDSIVRRIRAADNTPEPAQAPAEGPEGTSAATESKV